MHKNLALFDLDHTLLPLDSDQAWSRFITRVGWREDDAHVALIDEHYAHYAAGTLDMDAYLAVTLAPLTRYPRKVLERWHAQFMDEVIRPAITSQARELVDRHRENGDLCCIVTATNVFVTRPIAAEFGIEHLLGIGSIPMTARRAVRSPGAARACRAFAKARSCAPPRGWHPLATLRLISSAPTSIATRSTTCRCWITSRIRSPPIPTPGCCTWQARAGGLS